jgi:hypothetical protein
MYESVQRNTPDDYAQRRPVDEPVTLYRDRERFSLGESARLTDSKSAEEVIRSLEDLTDPYKADILRIGLRCKKGVEENRILCSIVVTANARGVASAIGGNVFGTLFLYRVIHPISRDFHCVNRRDGKLQEASCRCGVGLA